MCPQKYVLVSYVCVSQLSSVAHSCPTLCFATPRTAARQASLSISNSQSLLKLISIKLVMPSNPFHPLLSPSPSAFNLSQHQGLFQWVSSSHQVAKVLEVQLPMNIQDWFPLGLTGVSVSHDQPFATPWTIACQAPQSMEFSWQEYWNG